MCLPFHTHITWQSFHTPVQHLHVPINPLVRSINEVPTIYASNPFCYSCMISFSVTSSKQLIDGLHNVLSTIIGVRHSPSNVAMFLTISLVKEQHDDNANGECVLCRRCLSALLLFPLARQISGKSRGILSRDWH